MMCNVSELAYHVEKSCGHPWGYNMTFTIVIIMYPIIMILILDANMNNCSVRYLSWWNRNGE